MVIASINLKPDKEKIFKLLKSITNEKKDTKQYWQYICMLLIYLQSHIRNDRPAFGFFKYSQIKSLINTVKDRIPYYRECKCEHTEREHTPHCNACSCINYSAHSSIRINSCTDEGRDLFNKIEDGIDLDYRDLKTIIIKQYLIQLAIILVSLFLGKIL